MKNVAPTALKPAVSLPGLHFPMPAVIRPKNRIVSARAFDNMMTFDRRTVDSSGVFLIGELEKLDQTLNEPLVSIEWPDNIELREDVSMADEVSSFTNSTFAAVGGINPAGIAWAGKTANAIASVALDIGKTANPLMLWAHEISWTIPELASAEKLGRPVDQQKFSAMQLKHNMDTDQMVHIGDATIGYTGLFNSLVVTAGNVVNGAQGSPLWANKTPDEILADVNTLIATVWAAAGWARVPTDLRLPPVQYSYLVASKVSGQADKSILQYLLDNNMAKQRGIPLTILPSKWLIGQGVGGTPGVLGTVDRMVAYINDKSLVRYPLVPLQRTPLEYRSLYQITTYFGRLGVVEFVYPNTAGYADGL